MAFISQVRIKWGKVIPLPVSNGRRTAITTIEHSLPVSCDKGTNN